MSSTYDINWFDMWYYEKVLRDAGIFMLEDARDPSEPWFSPAGLIRILPFDEE